MEQINDIGYFSAHMGIYPRYIYIVRGNDKLKRASKKIPVCSHE